MVFFALNVVTKTTQQAVFVCQAFIRISLTGIYYNSTEIKIWVLY